MENFDDNFDLRIRLFNQLTNTGFCHTISSNSDHELYNLVKKITSDLDLFVKIIEDFTGLKNIQRILVRSNQKIITKIFFSFMKRFIDIMTLRNGHYFVSQVIEICNVEEKKLFYNVTFFHALYLARNENGCRTLKEVITEADDSFKERFIDLFSDKVLVLINDDFGNSLIKHVLKHEFMRKTKQEDMFMFSSSSFDRLVQVSSDLTSDSDLFVDFVRTRRGSLTVQLVLGKSEEVDTIFLEAIKKRFNEIITDRFGCFVMIRLMQAFTKRGNYEVYTETLNEIASQALYLTTYPKGSGFLQYVIHDHDEHRFAVIVSRLQRRFLELSFHQYGSIVVEMLIGDCKWLVALSLTVKEIVKSDEETVVRLAKDCYGNRILKKTLEFSKMRNVDWFRELVEKLKPLLDRLRGSQGENIAAFVDSNVRDS